MMRGRPVLGAISGFLFGLSAAVALFLYGVVPSSSIWLVLLPFLGMVLGLVMAWWAPFGSSDHGPQPETSDITYASSSGAADVVGDEPAGTADEGSTVAESATDAGTDTQGTGSSGAGSTDVDATEATGSGDAGTDTDTDTDTGE
jgi:hypothetical protein